MSTLGTKSCFKTLAPPRVNEEAKKPRHAFLDNMEAIACGVEAWFEENTGYSRRVTETTVAVARALGMPEGEIEKWAYSRSIHVAEKGRVVKSLLDRLQGSFGGVDNGEHLREMVRNQPGADLGVNRQGK